MRDNQDFPPSFVEWMVNYVITNATWGRRRPLDLSRAVIDLIQHLARNGKLMHAAGPDDICRCIAHHCDWRDDYRPFIELVWRRYVRIHRLQVVQGRVSSRRTNYLERQRRVIERALPAQHKRRQS